MRQGQQNRRGRGRGGRKGQNPLSRSFESSGPDIKIRGTAQHIAEKYMALARDAIGSGDLVLGENYLQHAEHYNRIIMAAQPQQQSAFGDMNGNGQRIARPEGDLPDGDGFEGDDEGEGEQPAMGQGFDQPRSYEANNGPREHQPRFRDNRNYENRNNYDNRHYDNRNNQRSFEPRVGQDQRPMDHRGQDQRRQEPRDNRDNYEPRYQDPSRGNAANGGTNGGGQGGTPNANSTANGGGYGNGEQPRSFEPPRPFDQPLPAAEGREPQPGYEHRQPGDGPRNRRRRQRHDRPFPAQQGAPAMNGSGDNPPASQDAQPASPPTDGGGDSSGGEGQA